ncbi:MAG: hypothetical protein QOG49_1042 [Frankiaceae bacterium]|nr:hypothetical protein [Frankiaceae bacterium]
MSAFSVVLPAHDEGSVIGTTLQTLLADAEPGEIELVVVCNGCADDTAARARSAAPSARVIELVEPSKSAALNAGDDAATVFPRFYVDADIAVSAQSLRRMVDLLDAGDRLAVAATVSHRAAASRSWLVRSYYRFWSSLPGGSSGIFGTGVIGLSREARARFGRWPDVIADDYYCDSLFSGDEKARHPDVHVELDVPGKVGALVRRKARVHNGNLQVRARFPTRGAVTNGASLTSVVRRTPALWYDAPAFIGLTLAARVLAAVDRRRGAAHRWRRDDSRDSRA